MTASISAAEVEQLRRNAKRLGRNLSIPHSEALDRIAAHQGFKNWSLLSKHSASTAAHKHERPTVPPTPPAHSLPPSDPRQRYYIHGDQYEADPGRFYCAHCDVFFDAEHFASHGPHTGERCLNSLERWKKRDWRTTLNLRRHDHAVNLLEAPALVARAQYQAMRPAFSDWLLVQRKRTRAGERRDRVGFMAIGLLSSRGLPTTPKSLALLGQHYETRGVQRHDIDSLYEAWDEFIVQTIAPP